VSKPVDLGIVKEGSYIMIDGEPCRVVEYDKSKPGKHGSAKARVVGIGVFDGVKRSLVSPVDSNVEVPIIEKRNSQVISVKGTTLQLMDLETFEVFELPLPGDMEAGRRPSSGVEAEYWQILGKRKIMRLKG